MKIEELSSGLLPSARNSVLLKFQTGQVDGIICSDALARGIDIPNVDVVISYDAPRHVKTYIHRIGIKIKIFDAINIVFHLLTGLTELDRSNGSCGQIRNGCYAINVK